MTASTAPLHAVHCVGERGLTLPHCCFPGLASRRKDGTPWVNILSAYLLLGQHLGQLEGVSFFSLHLADTGLNNEQSRALTVLQARPF